MILLDNGNLVRISSLGLQKLPDSQKRKIFPWSSPGLTGPSVHSDIAGSSKVSLVHPWKTRVASGQGQLHQLSDGCIWGLKHLCFLEMCSIHLKKIPEKMAAPLNVFTFLEISLNFQLSSQRPCKVYTSLVFSGGKEMSCCPLPATPSAMCGQTGISIAPITAAGTGQGCRKAHFSVME